MGLSSSLLLPEHYSFEGDLQLQLHRCQAPRQGLKLALTISGKEEGVVVKVIGDATASPC